MTNDRTITISAGSSRRATSWTSQTMLLSELWARLQTPVRGTETMAEYLGMKKPQQTIYVNLLKGTVRGSSP